MKKEIKNYMILIITILLIVFLTTKFSNTFGSNTDWINQHTIIPDYFRQLFYETGQLIPNFSFNYGAGQNIYNLSYYGLLSPVILLSYLFPFLSMTTYLSIVNIIILIASAILFYKWIKNNYQDDNICLITSLLFILAAPLIFHMHRHIMFVNYMPFLIMSLMGVDKLLKEKNKSFLIINIFLMIMTSYYYSVCGILVVCIYYLYQYLNKNKNIKTKVLFKDIFSFVGLIFVGIFMAGVLLLPTAYTLLSGRGEATSNIDIVSLFIPYLKIHKIFCGTYAIGLSLIAFIAILYLFFTKKRNNIVLGTMICIILFIPIFRYILNGGLYLREKCFIPFLPLISYVISYFLNHLFNNKINIKKFVIFLLLFFIPMYYFNQKEICYLFFVIFIFLLLIFNRYKCKKIISIYLVIVALYFAIYESNLEENVSINTYKEIFNENITSNINKTIENDKTYYRFNNLAYPTKTVNKIYNSNYYTTNIYSSTYNKYYLDFVRNTFETSTLDFNYFLYSSPNNLLFNKFMGVKYLYSTYNPGMGYENIGENVYVTNDVLPLIYATNHIINEDEFNNYGYPYQTELLLNNAIVSGKQTSNKIETTIKKIDLEYNVLENEGVEITQENNKYILTVKDKGNITIKINKELKNKILFIDIEGLKENSCSIDNISLKINNVENILTCRTWIYSNKNNIFRYVISDENLNELKLELTKGTYNIDNITTYILDYNNINQINDNIEKFNIEKIGNDKIIGNINLNNNSYLVTSIPYDEGFTVKVNNKEVDYEIVNKAFLGFPLEKGNYEIEISYKSPWLKQGKIISLIGGIIFIVLIINEKKQMTRK